MSLLKKAIYLFLVLIILSLTGCTLKSNENQLPKSKPKDFNFVFHYGVSAKNQLDTAKGQFTRDMVIDPSITTDLRLTDKEMNYIYSEMKKINILSYPRIFSPKSNTEQKPFDTYYIKIIFNGKEKSIFWIDKNISEEKEAVQLRDLFKKIQSILVSKEEYKKLPEPRSRYK